MTAAAFEQTLSSGLRRVHRTVTHREGRRIADHVCTTCETCSSTDPHCADNCPNR